MARPIWKGYISFGLVNIPVILYPAEQKSELKFHMLDSRDKSRIHYVRVNESGKEVPWEDVSKGFEYDEGKYILLKDADLKKIAGENTKTIDIENFVDQNSLDYMDFDKPYYLVPDKRGDKGYVILREILRETKKVGITKVIIHTRQYLAALMPYENALVLNLMRYHSEIKKPADFDLPKENLKEYKVSPKEMAVAKQLVNSMSVKWDPEKYQDEYKATLEKWLEERIHTESPRTHMKEKLTRAKGAKGVNFVDLLKKSLQVKKTRTIKKARNKPISKKSRSR